MSSIAFVLPGFAAHVGGGYQMVYTYSNHLAAQGHTVHIVQMRPEQFRGNGSVPSRAVRAARYFVGRRARPRWFRLDPRVSVTNYAAQAPEHIPEVDIIVATAMETADVVAATAARRGVRGCYFLQGYEDWKYPEALDATWRLPLEKIVVAPWLADKAVELGVTATVVRNAVDTEAFSPGPPIPNRPLRVTAMVSDVSWKRTDIVEQTYATIAERMPGVELVTFGVRSEPLTLPPGARHYSRPDARVLGELYRQTRVFVCASDHEGWGLPPGEALSAGAAVASTDTLGVRSFADGVALFSPVGDAVGLAENAMRLIADEELCVRLARDGQNRVRSYTLGMAAAEFERALLGSA